ncbi:uncharacterized protein LOC134764475 [Penaeus indicus]|uniref:uncharacterized protein LOC134764475 n=1 Tax=Penaeus indicus TaxID=29960 RepID=UPI00300C7B53
MKIKFVLLCLALLLALSAMSECRRADGDRVDRSPGARVRILPKVPRLKGRASTRGIGLLLQEPEVLRITQGLLPKSPCIGKCFRQTKYGCEMIAICIFSGAPDSIW